MPVLLVLLVAVIVELTVFIAVGHAIGVLATVGLLILTSLVGAALLRREGARALSAFADALRSRRPPHREVFDGMLITAAGLLIIVPGFVSDVLGLLLLLRPIRAVVRRRILRSTSPRTASPRIPMRYGPGDVVEGEVVDEPPSARSASGELR